MRGRLIRLERLTWQVWNIRIWFPHTMLDWAVWTRAGNLILHKNTCSRDDESSKLVIYPFRHSSYIIIISVVVLSMFWLLFIMFPAINFLGDCYLAPGLMINNMQCILVLCWCMQRKVVLSLCCCWSAGWSWSFFSEVYW